MVKCLAAEHFITFFCNELNKFNKTRARMLDFIYQMTLRLLKNVQIFALRMQRCFEHYFIT